MKTLFCTIVGLLFVIAQLPAQETVVFTESFSVSSSPIKLLASKSARRERASHRGGGNILLTLNNPDNIPMEWKTSVKAACDIWSDYLAPHDTVMIEVSFTDTLNEDIRMDFTRNLGTINDRTAFYPPCLLHHISPKKFPTQHDASILVNSKTNWSIGIGEESTSPSKNLTLTMMQCIARTLGFGSSISLKQRGTLEVGRSKIPSIFDFYIKNSKGQRLTDYLSNRRGLQQFAEGKGGKVYFATANKEVALYTPSSFDPYASLKFVTDTTSLMGYPLRQNRDLTVDDLTLELLNEIGWNLTKRHKEEIQIATDSIDNSGITSIYKSHLFYIKPAELPFSSYHWKLVLMDKNNQKVEVASSHEPAFSLSPLKNADQYAHTIEGDIRGWVTFEGTSLGRTYTATYPIIFEQKPLISSVNIVSIAKNQDNPDYYDAVIEIQYAGAYYLHAHVEEEYSPYLTSYFSPSSYFARFHLQHIDSWGGAWLHLSAKNEYGKAQTVVDLGEAYEAAALANATSTSSVTHIATPESTPSSVIKMIYDLKGIYLGQYNTIFSKLPSGVYLSKTIDTEGKVLKVEKIFIP